MPYTVLHLSCLFHFLGFGISVNFNTKVISILLPVHTTVCDAEQIPNTQLFSTWHSNNGYSGWNILCLWYPVGYHVVRRTPGEISEDIQQFELLTKLIW